MGSVQAQQQAQRQAERQAQRQALGDYGEAIAARHLAQQGMVLLDRNWRCDQGEIDLVARDVDTLVVCEVKTRRGLDYGSPLEAVTARKLLRLRRLAGCWLTQHAVHPREVRIDVVGVLRRPQGPALVEHLRGVC
jgi:putative endonuclease